MHPADNGYVARCMAELRIRRANIIVIIMTVLMLTLAGFMMSPTNAYAANAGDSDYAKELLSDGKGGTLGWDETQVEKIEGYDSSRSPDQGGVNDFTNAASRFLSSIVITFLTIMTVVFIGKITGRGCLELVYGDDKRRVIPNFFLASTERSDSSMGSANNSQRAEHWVKTMFLDFAKYYAIAIAVMFVLSLIVGVVVLIYTSASQAGLNGTFSAGGVNFS